MATIKLFLTNLRRSRLLYVHSHIVSSLPPSLPTHHSRRALTPQFFSGLNFPPAFCSRPFSTRSSNGDSFVELPTESEHISVGLHQVTEGVIVGSGEGSILLPVDALISMLDWYHGLTGLPWWMIIVSSTVAMRLTMFPLLILQLNKLKRIAECFPKLFPPTLSQRSYIDQYSLFRKERRAMGCPSYLWFLAYPLVQVPCFFLWMYSIRRMSMDHHLAFDCGGALWFQNLTEFAHGVSGPIFPLLIASLHFTSVQLYNILFLIWVIMGSYLISFGMSSTGKVTGLLGLFAKYYEIYLKLLTLPLFFIGFCIPQGSLIYWVTNSSLTVIQQLVLKHPGVGTKLGIREKDGPRAAATPVPDKIGIEFRAFLDSKNGQQQDKVCVHNLSAKEILALSDVLLSKGEVEKSIPLLQLAINKDPENVRPLIVMGQTLMHEGMPAEAAEYLEHAISKLLFSGHPTEMEDVDLLIVASQCAGVVRINQGKWEEGIAHLERSANMKEPDEPKSKAHYFGGLVLLSSALCKQGRKDEAVKYMRLAAAYNPAACNLYLEQCQKDDDDDDFVSHLTCSTTKGGH